MKTYKHNQEIFDKVATHLFQQGRQAVDDGGSCMYRTEEGLSCAVGCLIPNREYRKGMEDLTVITLLATYEKLENNFINISIDFLRNLQQTHDSTVNWKNQITLKNALKEVAILHNVNPSILKDLHFKNAA